MTDPRSDGAEAQDETATPVEAAILDGTVGGFAELDASASAAGPDPTSIHVTISGPTTDLETAALATDLGLLLRRVLNGPPPGPEETAAPPSARALPDGVEIAVHGLGLEPEHEAHVHRLLRAHLAERTADKGATSA